MASDSGLFKTIFWGCLKYRAVRFISGASRFYGHYHKTGISRFWSLLRPWDLGHLGRYASGAASNPWAVSELGLLISGLIVSGAVSDLVSGCFRSGIVIVQGHVLIPGAT